ncbi:CpsD/CapB family tyrosine-protein kinase [Streptomyces sp. A7024]|uniref:CpsD/CapB family tyrosine-protein kinase n=1 Tax=Streptomyces coryli TaxID=1128680 RepID=A0A6G4TTR4_9ACTN|nr:CpsD/CapB family tyrosine-protein kinase [Streptomyces coryli]NGN63203.1 CpsD/CapB family tyrosine-protein kinase [Streptomyces coryli]
MSVVALVSAHSGSVTCSSLALALASMRPTLLAECDPAGGTIRGGLLQGNLEASVGLHKLATADRQGPAALAVAFERQLRMLDTGGDRQFLAGLTDPRQAASLAGTWPQLAHLLELMDRRAFYDVIIDCGRLVVDAGGLHPHAFPAPLLHRADAVLLVTDASDASLALSKHALEILGKELVGHGSDAEALGLLLVERGRYNSHTVEKHLRAPMLGIMPWDVPTADYLCLGAKQPRGLARTPLMRAARSSADQIDAYARRRQTRREYSVQPANPQVADVIDRIARLRQNKDR